MSGDMPFIKDLPSPNYDERDGAKIEYLIFHYTGMENAQVALDRLTDPMSKVSAHYTVDEDGTIYQHVAEDKRAWHAGKSYWNGALGINQSSIGVEIVNPGHEFGYRHFTPQQIDSVAKLSIGIIKRYDLDKNKVLAHSDIAPSRKEDPGEFFPWEELAQKGIGVWTDLAKNEDAALRLDIEKALHGFGYDPDASYEDKLIAFQRHFVPEVFEVGQVGQETDLTKMRLYALL